VEAHWTAEDGLGVIGKQLMGGVELKTTTQLFGIFLKMKLLKPWDIQRALASNSMIREG
jgi:hypothetical protein